ncbi:hypothetical protein STEG23_015476 [Scotinomys teguina]
MEKRREQDVKIPIVMESQPAFQCDKSTGTESWEMAQWWEWRLLHVSVTVDGEAPLAHFPVHDGLQHSETVNQNQPSGTQQDDPVVDGQLGCFHFMAIEYGKSFVKTICHLSGDMCPEEARLVPALCGISRINKGGDDTQSSPPPIQEWGDNNIDTVYWTQAEWSKTVHGFN